MLDFMSKSYKITAPVPVANKKPGDVVDASEVPDAAFLQSIGFLVLVESGAASSTMKKPSKTSTGESLSHG